MVNPSKTLTLFPPSLTHSFPAAAAPHPAEATATARPRRAFGPREFATPRVLAPPLLRFLLKPVALLLSQIRHPLGPSPPNLWHCQAQGARRAASRGLAPRLQLQLQLPAARGSGRSHGGELRNRTRRQPVMLFLSPNLVIHCCSCSSCSSPSLFAF